jgi:hypothetical protein
MDTLLKTHREALAEGNHGTLSAHLTLFRVPISGPNEE